MPYLDRASFIDLLKRLGAETDDERLAAAREINRRMEAAEVGWDELLVRAPGTAPIDRLEDYDDPDTDVGDFEIRDRHGDQSLAEQEPYRRAGRAFCRGTQADRRPVDAATVAIETRRELLDLRADIAANEFAEMDRRYLRDLAARLNAP